MNLIYGALLLILLCGCTAPKTASALIKKLGFKCDEMTKKCVLKKIANQKTKAMLFSADGA
jgi:hypothetical protein